MKNRLFIIPLIATLTLTACGPTTVVETPPTQENPDVIVETPATPDVVETKEETSGKLTPSDCISDPELAAIFENASEMTAEEVRQKVDEYAANHTEPVEFTMCDHAVGGVRFKNNLPLTLTEPSQDFESAFKPWIDKGAGQYDWKTKYSPIYVIKAKVMGAGADDYDIWIDMETAEVTKLSFVPWAALNLDANDDFRPWFDKVDLDTSVKDEVFE